MKALLAGYSDPGSLLENSLESVGGSTTGEAETSSQPSSNLKNKDRTAVAVSQVKALSKGILEKTHHRLSQSIQGMGWWSAASGESSFQRNSKKPWKKTIPEVNKSIGLIQTKLKMILK